MGFFSLSFCISARFIRAVSELEFLGFIKSTKQKTDHVARLTWGGCWPEGNTNANMQLSLCLKFSTVSEMSVWPVRWYFAQIKSVEVTPEVHLPSVQRKGSISTYSGLKIESAFHVCQVNFQKIFFNCFVQQVHWFQSYNIKTKFENK